MILIMLFLSLEVCYEVKYTHANTENKLTLKTIKRAKFCDELIYPSNNSSFSLIKPSNIGTILSSKLFKTGCSLKAIKSFSLASTKLLMAIE